jgi:thymidylate synthase
MTLLITCYSAAQAHETLVHKIMNPRYSREILTENGEITREITDVRVKITCPLEAERFSSKCFMKSKGFVEYANNLIHGYKDNVTFEYDYNERLRKWGKNKISLFDKEVKIDQINYIIHKLQQEQNSRRALAITWIPPYDNDHDDVPCLQYVQFLIRDGKLDMFVLFRSEDILSAFGQNVYGLTSLQKYIANALQIPIGNYYHYIVSAHIYYIRDSHELGKFEE